MYSYSTKSVSKTRPSTRFTYSCAQLKSRQHASRKTNDTKKQRDKGLMETFDCDGWLHITVWDDVETFKSGCKE